MTSLAMKLPWSSNFSPPATCWAEPWINRNPPWICLEIDKLHLAAQRGAWNLWPNNLLWTCKNHIMVKYNNRYWIRIWVERSRLLLPTLPRMSDWDRSCKTISKKKRSRRPASSEATATNKGHTCATSLSTKRTKRISERHRTWTTSHQF